MDFTREEKEVGWGWLEFTIFNLLHQVPEVISLRLLEQRQQT